MEKRDAFSTLYLQSKDCCCAACCPFSQKIVVAAVLQQRYCVDCPPHHKNKDVDIHTKIT
jgi:hypothetical protein